MISYGESRDEDCDGFGEIWALYVSPKCWRNGYGQALIEYAEEMARDSQMPNLVLWVLEKNRRGRSFYERVGYVPDAATKKVEIGKVQLEEIRYIKTVG